MAGRIAARVCPCVGATLPGGLCSPAASGFCTTV